MPAILACFHQRRCCDAVTSHIRRKRNLRASVPFAFGVKAKTLVVFFGALSHSLAAVWKH
jgi:hypothetical protein